jgi:hypothetical protein
MCRDEPPRESGAIRESGALADESTGGTEARGSGEEPCPYWEPERTAEVDPDWLDRTEYAVSEL